MHGRIVIVHISGIRTVVGSSLYRIHGYQLFGMCRVAQGLTILRFREVSQYKLTVTLRLRTVVAYKVHQIHIVVHIQAVDIVRIARQQSIELTLSRCIITELILQNDTHIVQAVLNHIIRHRPLGIVRGNLLQIIFRIVRVSFMCHRLTILFFRSALLDLFSIGHVIISLLKFAQAETIFIPAAPVILKPAATPALLEVSAAGIAGGGIVEVP